MVSESQPKMFLSWGTPWLVDCGFCLAVITIFLLLPTNADTNDCDSELQVTSEISYYQSDGFSIYRLRGRGYKNNMYCEISFRTEDGAGKVKIEVINSDLEGDDDGSRCYDKVTVYDGPSKHDPGLGFFCGKETPKYESTGPSMLIVFETDSTNDRNYRGFKLKYFVSYEGNTVPGTYEKSSSSMGVGTIVAAVVPGVILYCVLFIVCYKYAQRARQNMTANAQASEEMRLARVAVANQARQRPQVRGQDQALLNGSSNGVAVERVPTDTSPHVIGATERPRRGRIRHPAGDIHNLSNQNTQSPLLVTNHHGLQDDTCSGYGSDREQEHRPVSDGILGPGHILPIFPPDPTGVYYAGSVDEHGILHPPGSQSQLSFPSAPTPSVASSTHGPSYLVHHLEDDRRSRGSSRSRRSSRNSPRESSRGGNSVHGSPYRNRVHSQSHGYNGSPRGNNFLDSEGQTLTFYGMIDGDPSRGEGQVGGSMSGSVVLEDISLSAPPPSYEDAATGKYSPQFYKPQ